MDAGRAEEQMGEDEVPDLTAREVFYRDGKSILLVEWWLDDLELEYPSWVRVRSFDDGTADLCRGDGETLHGFDCLEIAHDHLAITDRDHFLCARITAAGEKGSARILGVTIPNWLDRPDQKYEFHFDSD